MTAFDVIIWALFFLGVVFILFQSVRIYKREREKIHALQRAIAAPADLPDTQTPRISALVPAWNEAENIKQLISSFQALRYPSKELIIVAGGNDDTYDSAKALSANMLNVTVIAQRPKMGKQVALRDGLLLVTGDIVFLTDADCVFDDNSLEKTLKPVIHDGYMAATGGSQPLQRQKNVPIVIFQWAVEFHSRLYASEHSSGILGRNCAVRTRAIHETGGFEVDAPSGTDYTLARQLVALGYKIKFVASSAIETEYPESARMYFNKKTRWLRNIIVLGYQMKDWASFRAGLRTSLVGIVFLSLPLIGILHYGFWLLWLLLFFQGVSARIRYLFLLEGNKGLRALGIAILSLPFDAYIWANGLLQSVFPSLRAPWR